MSGQVTSGLGQSVQFFKKVQLKLKKCWVICPLIGQQLILILPPSYWPKCPLIGQQLIRVLQLFLVLLPSFWPNYPLIGQQLLLVLPPSYWPKCPLIGQRLIRVLPPSYWIIAIWFVNSSYLPSLTTLLLAQMSSDWSTAHQSLTTFLLGNCHLVGPQLLLVLLPSYWLNHPLIVQQLLLVLPLSDWLICHLIKQIFLVFLS